MIQQNSEMGNLFSKDRWMELLTLKFIQSIIMFMVVGIRKNGMQPCRMGQNIDSIGISERIQDLV